MTIIYLNGEFMPLSEARIPVMDRGFLFGDGVYELIPVYSRQPFRLAEHLRRLQFSLDGMRLDNPRTPTEWKTVVERVVAEADFDDQQVYLQVTRGSDTRRNHAFPQIVRPTVFIMTEPLLAPPQEQRDKGVSAVSAIDIRWLRCDIKSVSLLANCLLRQISVEADCFETVLFRDGFLTEGSASNIFVVRNGVLLAPPKTHLMLPGITYDVVLELAAAHDLKHEVREVREAEVRSADELWLTSSNKEVLPIVSLDGSPVGNGAHKGKPGTLFALMHGWYQQYKATVMRDR